MPVLDVPLHEVISQLDIGRRHVVIRETEVESFLKAKILQKCKLSSSMKIDVRNVKSICQSLRRQTKSVGKGTKQKKLFFKKVHEAPPLKVNYELGADAIKAFITTFQTTISSLEKDLKKAKKQQIPRESGKSPRNIRRIKGAALKQIRLATGQEQYLLPKQSPRKTTVQLDQAGVSVRQYSRMKGPHQPAVRLIPKARNVLNEQCTDVAMLLKTLVAKCQCAGPARVKVSVDGHNPTKNSSAVTFSLSLTCEPNAQSAKHVVPVMSVPGAETYELVRDSKAWESIEAELRPVIDIGDRVIHVDYYLCADLKSLLLHLGFKSANARDVCLYCTCTKERWGTCCYDGKCTTRHVRTSDGILLPSLSRGKPGYKQPPLANAPKYVTKLCLRAACRFESLLRCVTAESCPLHLIGSATVHCWIAPA